MPSSSNSSAPKVARQNSSLFGAIKNIVAAPLTWLAGADQHDHKGKRRRQQADSEPDIDQDVDQGTPRSKRMRVVSPPRMVPSSSYLDPPSSVFQPLPKRRTPAPVARSSSASAYNLNPARNARPTVPRSTLSPIRLGRTMSIDPPLQIRRETSLHDVVMESALAPMARERSMPAVPLTSRPSFRMRSSLTPQPQREVSEPPPLTSLRSKPTFVRAPPVQRETQPITTLGNLAETVRSNHSPVRQHSSLLFGSSVQLDSRDRRSESVPVEKALYELDIYKTPLVPTRLRSANSSSTAAAIPDMFKSRRSSQLVLMQDDRKKMNGSHKSPQANETKPYAGEGGMKKLLARRKQEADRPTDEIKTAFKPMDEDEAGSSDVLTNPAPAATPPSDWFAAASAGATSTSSGSSLRVGRSKTSRNHISRPAISRSRLKFSAVYEEDGDDAMDADEDARQREHTMLNEASKKMPVFELPAGFSFAKPEAKPLQNDLTNAKEPPIVSLPFSFGKPSQPSEPKPEEPTSRKENSEIDGLKPFRTLAEAPPLSLQADSKDAKGNGRETFMQSSATGLSSGIPNFFANSTLVTKPLDLPAAAPPTFSSTSLSPEAKSNGASSLFGGFGASNQVPINDKENPFWEGDKGTGTDLKPKNDSSKAPPHFVPSPSTSTPSNSLPFSFGSPAIISHDPSVSTPAPFSFGKSLGEKQAIPAFANEAAEPPAVTEGPPAPKPLFGGFGLTATQTTKAIAASDSPKLANIFGNSNTAKPAANTSAPLGPTSTSTFSFGSSAPTPLEQPKSLFGTAAPESSKPSFGSAPPVETPKPLFGSGAPFSFNSEKPALPKPSSSPVPFTFGAAPSTPAQTNGTSGAPSFSFGTSPPPATPAPVPPISFSFSGHGTSVPGAQNNSFTFGPPGLTERPVTPPKNNDQEFRMEESPTREVPAAGIIKPTLNFSFGNSTNPSALFGAPAQANTLTVPPLSSQFSFNGSVPGPFSPAKTEDSAKPFTFGATPTPTPTATTPIGTPFSFGPSKSSGGDVGHPNTGGGFSFGGASTPTTTMAPFSFGNAAPPAPPSLFVTAPTISAPNSPSTFSQASPFSFNAPLPSPFAFGSQPASPAGSNSGLPPTGFGTTSSGFGQAAPSSPFSSPAPLTPSTSSGGTLFTIGAAPMQAPAGGTGPRQIRKLPTRRTGGKR